MVVTFVSFCRYVTEIIPFSLRAKAHSLWALTQASMLVFNQYVNPIALKHLAWKYYVRIHFLNVVVYGLTDST